MRVAIHDNAVADLERLWSSDEKSAARIEAFIEVARDDPRIAQTLTTHGDTMFGSVSVNCKRWVSVGRSENLWRLRILDTPAQNYRIVYGYYYPHKELWILAIVNRKDMDYDDASSPVFSRIIADWDSVKD